MMIHMYRVVADFINGGCVVVKPATERPVIESEYSSVSPDLDIGTSRSSLIIR